MRQPEELMASASGVIDQAFSGHGALQMFPLFSGGHDSICATFVASRHPRFGGHVHHINTGIGAIATREYVDTVCREFDWSLHIHKSPATYERFVRRLGFPGPGSHQWVYNWLKDRCVSRMIRSCGPSALITGCREQESVRRMGHVEPIKIGETSKKTGRRTKQNRIWTAPCFDWSSEEQRSFMYCFDLPRNPIKDSPLAMSGECFCGAFARPDEIRLIRQYAPDVAIEIDRLSRLARTNAKPSVWGVRPDRKKGVALVETGLLCNSCDSRAAAAGVIFTDVTSEAQ